MFTTRLNHIKLCGLALALLSNIASAAIIDQANDGVYAGGFTINAGPIGQSFQPGLTSLDFVELLINDQNPGFGTGDDIAVRIRDATITGTILGSSQNVFFADQAPQSPFQVPQIVHFDFTSAVMMIPGQSYVIEVFRNGAVSSDLGIFGTGFNNDAYVNGDSYFQGALYTGTGAPLDLWFREGVSAVPLPAALPLLLSGLSLLVFARKTQRKPVV